MLLFSFSLGIPIQLDSLMLDNLLLGLVLANKVFLSVHIYNITV